MYPLTDIQVPKPVPAPGRCDSCRRSTQSQELLLLQQTETATEPPRPTANAVGMCELRFNPPEHVMIAPCCPMHLAVILHRQYAMHKPHLGHCGVIHVHPCPPVGVGTGPAGDTGVQILVTAHSLRRCRRITKGIPDKRLIAYQSAALPVRSQRDSHDRYTTRKACIAAQPATLPTSCTAQPAAQRAQPTLGCPLLGWGVGPLLLLFCPLHPS